MKVLLTGFDPFGGESVNPALEAVKLVADRLGDIEIVKLEVPTVFYKSIETVDAKIAEVKRDVVLCIGQAGGRFDITPERVAINVNDARIKEANIPGMNKTGNHVQVVIGTEVQAVADEMAKLI